MASDTNMDTPKETAAPEDLRRTDWREPVEVITPENANRVEKVFQLDFTNGMVKFTRSPEGSFLGGSLLNGDYILDAKTFEKIFCRWRRALGIQCVD